MLTNLFGAEAQRNLIRLSDMTLTPNQTLTLSLKTAQHKEVQEHYLQYQGHLNQEPLLEQLKYTHHQHSQDTNLNKNLLIPKTASAHGLNLYQENQASLKELKILKEPKSKTDNKRK